MGVVVTLPFTLLNGTTADATQVMANYNALVTGFLSAAAAGANSDITALLGLTTPLVYTAGGSSAYIGGTSTGTANAQAVASATPLGFSLATGKRLLWIAGATNTGATTLNAVATGATNVFKNTPAGLVALTGGEIISGGLYETVFDGTRHVLTNPSNTVAGIQTTLASATTTDLGTIPSHNVSISGTTTITGFGSSAVTAYPLYFLTFTGVLTLTYDGTALILPGGANIITAAGDTAITLYLGSGNWKVLSYTPAVSLPGSQTIAGGYRNLIVTGTSDTQWTCTADAITLENSSGAAKRLSSVSVTCAITSSGANGLDTGAEAGNTWYFCWLIYNPTTNTIASLMSASATAPTLPSGYTFKVRVGAVRNDGSSNLWRSIQYGRRAQVTIGTNPSVVPVVSSGIVGTFSTTSPTLASTSLASFVPTTACSAYLFATSLWKGGVTSQYCIAPSTAYGGTNRGLRGSSGNLYPMGIDSAANHQSTWMELESSAIGIASDAAGFALACAGWEDNL